MSKELIIYNLNDDEIVGLYKLNDSSAALYPVDPLTQGRIDLPINHPIFEEQNKWRVSGRALILKAEVVISSNKGQVVADGIDEVKISFTGLVAPVLASLGKGLSHGVTPADPEIILTSDVPRRFVVEIDDKLHFAEPIFVEAQ